MTELVFHDAHNSEQTKHRDKHEQQRNNSGFPWLSHPPALRRSSSGVTFASSPAPISAGQFRWSPAIEVKDPGGYHSSAVSIRQNSTCTLWL